MRIAKILAVSALILANLAGDATSVEWYSNGDADEKPRRVPYNLLRDDEVHIRRENSGLRYEYRYEDAFANVIVGV